MRMLCRFEQFSVHIKEIKMCIWGKHIIHPLHWNSFYKKENGWYKSHTVYLMLSHIWVVSALLLANFFKEVLKQNTKCYYSTLYTRNVNVKWLPQVLYRSMVPGFEKVVNFNFRQLNYWEYRLQKSDQYLPNLVCAR